MYRAAKLPVNEMERLKALRDLEILDTFPETAFDKITSLAAELADAPICLISLVDSDRQWFKSKVGLLCDDTPRDVAFCSHTILEDDVFVIPDATADERFRDNPLVVGPPYIRSYAGAPLITRDKQRIGTLCVIHTSVMPLSALQLRQLRALADLAMDELELRTAVRNAAKASAAARAAEATRLELLASMDRRLRTPLTTAQTFARMLDSRKLNGELKNFVHVIRRSTDTAMDVLEDMQTLSELETNDISLSSRVFSVNDLLAETDAFWRSHAQEAGLALHLSADLGGSDVVRADEVRIRQALFKLIERTFNLSKGDTVTVSVRWHEEDSKKLVFRVSEVNANGQRGRSSAADQLTSLPANRISAGTNETTLALSIVSHLANLMDGEIMEESVCDNECAISFSVGVSSILKVEESDIRCGDRAVA